MPRGYIKADQPGRKRRLPRTPPAPAQPERRYYCPGCGMVRPDTGVRQAPDGASVIAHRIYSPGPWPVNAWRTTGESLDYETCPGGAIDLTKDRAP